MKNIILIALIIAVFSSCNVMANYQDDGIGVKFGTVAEVMEYTNSHIAYDDGYIPSIYSWHGPKTTYDRQRGVCADAAIFAAYLIERDTSETCHLILAYRKSDNMGHLMIQLDSNGNWYSPQKELYAIPDVKSDWNLSASYTVKQALEITNYWYNSKGL